MPPLRLVFFGSDPISLPLLDRLRAKENEGVKIVALYTQPDRPSGRGQRVAPNAIKRWALGHDIEVRQPEKITAEVRHAYADLRPDLALVMAYGKILRPRFIQVPRLGTLNLHASLLPAYRGASPIQSAVARGESHTGISLMRIVPELDAGPVADTERVAIDPLDTALDVEARLAHACVRLIDRHWAALAAGALQFHEQDHARATFCRRLSKEDCALDFRAPAKVLAARINGLAPWPATGFELDGQFIKTLLADTADTADNAPVRDAGEVLGSDPDGLLVATGADILRIHRLQRPGGKALAAADFLRGFPIPSGTRLPSVEMPALVGQSPG